MAAHPAKAANEKTASVAKAPAPQPVDFSKVQMVTLKDNSGVGFFDPETGTVYIYDASLSKCVAIKKLKALGEPTITIEL